MLIIVIPGRNRPLLGIRLHFLIYHTFSGVSRNFNDFGLLFFCFFCFQGKPGAEGNARRLLTKNLTCSFSSPLPWALGHSWPDIKRLQLC